MRHNSVTRFYFSFLCHAPASPTILVGSEPPILMAHIKVAHVMLDGTKVRIWSVLLQPSHPPPGLESHCILSSHTLKCPTSVPPPCCSLPLPAQACTGRYKLNSYRCRSSTIRPPHVLMRPIPLLSSLEHALWHIHNTRRPVQGPCTGFGLVLVGMKDCAEISVLN